MEDIGLKEKEENIKSPRMHIGFDIDNFQYNVETFYGLYPFFYDKNKIFWAWNDQLHKYDIVDEVDLMCQLDESLEFFGESIPGKIKRDYIEALKRVGRRKAPIDAPVKWIQFKDKAFSLNSGNIYEVTPEYFFTNPIPHSIGETSDTPTIDKLFVDWVG